MKKPLMRFLFSLLILLYTGNLLMAQMQACPVNINFSAGAINLWTAQTGLVGHATQDYPAPNTGVSSINEYNIGNTGIQIFSGSAGNDPFGFFPVVPVINGYAYNYSVKLGSTATSYDLHASTNNPGGFTRSLTYIINVPAGPVSIPYTMTYAYAMVLENGTHNSNEQPLFKATLSTHDSVITCASPQYYLPTFNNAGTGSVGATLDTAAALANGFTNSPVLFLSHAGAAGNSGSLLQDVWTKGWREVTFDLSPFRGQQVTLTFEADNCTPGAHFAYAYVALRNTCAGLEISGPLQACTNTPMTYSIPALANAAYNWTVPAGWVITSGGSTNIITVTPGATGGQITAQEINGCADLRDTIQVTTSPPTVPGAVTGGRTVCSGTNSTVLTLSGHTGSVQGWLSSTDAGATWTYIPVTTTAYTAQNLTVTTQFAAIVQNGTACKIDTSAKTTIVVDPKSVGGVLSPASSAFCAGQNTNNLISLSGQTGTVVNWQISHDLTNWSGFTPVYTATTYAPGSVTSNTQFRVIVQSGVCPADTSAPSVLTYYPVPYPQTNINPANPFICYGENIQLNGQITIGTDYSWNNTSFLTGQTSGTVPGLPYTTSVNAHPIRSTDFVLTTRNTGCPNPRTDTFHVTVAPRIVVFAGNDTSVVVNQPVQLLATVSDPSATQFSWTPSTGLNNTLIYNPVATLTNPGTSVMYVVRATNPNGCYGEDNIIVRVFANGPDIYVPTAFTPNKDGLNDDIKPICVGIRELVYFRIFNRWGQEVFHTSTIGSGWDGNISNVPQGTAEFVWMVQGIDYMGNTITKKGNLALIR